MSLVGPTGSGRSRLLHELTRGLTTVDGMPVRWCVATCQPYPDQVMAPAAELLRGLAGVRHGDGPAVVHDRLVAALASLFPPERVAAAIPALQRFLTTPDGSSAALAGAAICRDVLLRLAAHQPLIVAVDDVDRAAPAMSRFLHALFSTATARGLPLALITLHQPQWADTRPSPARRVTIGPLATVQSGRLLRHLLTRAGQPVTLADRLLHLVGGRPGHAAAYVRSIVDGADRMTLPLPDAVRRAVCAELDHLDGERRAVLMAAATIGGVVSGAAVDRALGWAPGRSAPALRGLVAAGLLLPRRADGYAFVAPALRQVAAERLPRALRAVFGRRAAEAPRLDTVRPDAALPRDHAAADRAGSDRAAASRWVRPCCGRPSWVRPCWVRPGWVRPRWVRSGCRQRLGRAARRGRAPRRRSRPGRPPRRRPRGAALRRHRPAAPRPPQLDNGHLTDRADRRSQPIVGLPPAPGRCVGWRRASDPSVRDTEQCGRSLAAAPDRSPATIRAVPAVPGPAGRTAAAVRAPPDVVRTGPRPPLIRWPTGLAASA